jgi:hypothetical protein
MKALTGLILLALSGGGIAAELYKWVDEKGVTNYGEKPPANRGAKPVDTNTGGIIESGKLYGKKPEADRSLQSGADSAKPRIASAPPPPEIRGMGFDVYSRLERGMTEGELLQRAGKPDHVSLDGFEIQKTFYYFPTSGNPYTTAVTLRGGRISEIERIKKF